MARPFVTEENGGGGREGKDGGGGEEQGWGRVEEVTPYPLLNPFPPPLPLAHTPSPHVT